MIRLIAVLVVFFAAWNTSAADPSHKDPAGCPLHAGHITESGTIPELPGQSAWGAIAEIVQILEEDPATDWSRVDIDALRDHLIDMEELVLHALTTRRSIPGGLELTVTGSGRTVGAIQRMLPPHADMMRHGRGWKIATALLEDGAVLTATSAEGSEEQKIRGLGLFGFMSLGHHHGPHHLAIARGANPHRSP